MLFKELTEQQQQNLVKLHSFMVSTYGDIRHHDNFNMEVYQRCGFLNQREYFTKHKCDTSACLAGHGPMAGIEKKAVWSWPEYILRVFGLDWNTPTSAFPGVFLFSSGWSDDIQEAITRLSMYINGFDPYQEEWSYDDRYTRT